MILPKFKFSNFFGYSKFHNKNVLPAKRFRCKIVLINHSLLQFVLKLIMIFLIKEKKDFRILSQNTDSILINKFGNTKKEVFDKFLHLGIRLFMKVHCAFLTFEILQTFGGSYASYEVFEHYLK